jgi:rSAM/selenodomain-associated transferase 1
MAKSPEAGRVKTRLARDLGTSQAVRFYRVLLNHTLLRLGADGRWRTLLAITPDHPPRPRCMRAAARRMKTMTQGKGDLGERMQSLFRRAPLGPVILVGADIPGINVKAIATAFRLLGNADAVFGPATDGGYWLIGLKRRPRLLNPFGGVRWSSPHALTDTLSNLAGRRIAFAVTLGDVDCADALRASGNAWQRLFPPRQTRLG